MGICLMASCANRGMGPQGGPIDTIPPQVVKTTPQQGAKNYTKNDVVVNFDEFIQLDNPSENVLISPPQLHPAQVQSTGKRVNVIFQDSLKANTTYTIDFGNAIQDIHEKTPLKNYVFTFSTGESMDSLAIFGTILDAQTLNPLSGIVVGIHENHEDSTFEKTSFLRIGRTNHDGEFSIRNVHEGTYRLLALNDISRDFRYQPGEGLAMCDSLITPYIHMSIETDTIWKDSLQADSIIRYPDSIYTAKYYYYEPENILLKFFTEDLKHVYFERALRQTPEHFTLCFNAPQIQMPEIKALRLESDSMAKDSNWVNFMDYVICQPNKTKDSITYWLTDSAAIRMDTLRFAMTYAKTDSLYQLTAQTDTLQVIYRASKTSKNVKTKNKKAPTPTLEIVSNAKNNFHIYDTIYVGAGTPIASLIQDSIHLSVKHDTLWDEIAFTLQACDSAYTRYWIHYQQTQGGEYQLRIDSAGMTNIYGQSNPTKNMQWTIHKTEDYATLKIHLQPFEAHAVVELLNDKDKPIYTQSAKDGGIYFEHLMPGTYYMRMYIDSNEDGKWTTGSWKEHRQPEDVFYFSKKLTLRANWDFEESFDWKSTPIEMQKPEALLPTKKNK